jgi:hypothetical protein
MSRVRLIPLVCVVLAVAWSVVGTVAPRTSALSPPMALDGSEPVFVTTLTPDVVAGAASVTVRSVDEPPPPAGSRWFVAPGLRVGQPSAGTRFDETAHADGWREIRVVSLDGAADDALAPTQRSARRVLHEELRQARVELVDTNGEARLCTAWRFGRWDCGPEPWNFVGLEDVVVQDRATTCLWLHPVAGERWRITWPDVPIARLSGRSAMSDVAAANDRPGAVSYRVLWGDELVLEREHPQQRGWRRFSVRLQAEADGTGEGSGAGSGEGVASSDARRPLHLEVWADEVAQRQFCMDMTLHVAGGAR